MICCNYLKDIYPKDNTGRCEKKRLFLVNLEDCNNCPYRFFNFEELFIGQFYYNVDTHCDYIKISNLTAFDLDNNGVKYIGLDETNNCLLSDYEVWLV